MRSNRRTETSEPCPGVVSTVHVTAMPPAPGWNRRKFLAIGAASLLGSPRQLSAGSEPRFWEKEDPASWTPEQIQQLTSKSPWAKTVTADLTNGVAPVPSGGGRRGGRRGGGGAAPTTTVPRFPAVIRWASAKPIREALKLKLPESLAEHLVISVTGVPIPTPDQGASDQGGANSDAYSALKQQTTLESHHGDAVQAGVAYQDPEDTSTIYFGFLPSLVNVADAKTASFSMNTGMLIAKAKFNLGDMRYRGELAV